MKPTIRDVSAGERPSAGWANEVKDAATHGHVGMGFSSKDEHVVGEWPEAQLTLYQLTDDPELDDDWKEYKATAKPCVLRFCTVDGDGHVTAAATAPGSGKERYYFDDDAEEETIWFFDGARDDHTEPVTAPTAKDGDRVWTSLVMGIRIVVRGGGAGLTPRILYDDVAPGDTDKNAWPVKDDLTADTDADKVLVQNTFPGNFRGYGDAHTGFDATTAAKVWTAVDSAGKEQIVCGKGLAKLCRAVAKGAISGSTGTVDAVTVMDDGQSPVANPTTAELPVLNPWNYYLADDALCQITRNGSGWDITNVVMVDQDFEVAESVDGLDLKHTWRGVRVNPIEAVQAAVAWHTGDDCSA